MDDRKAVRAAQLLTTPDNLRSFLNGITNEELRNSTLERLRPHLKFEFQLETK